MSQGNSQNLYTDPIGTAETAAREIAALTGVSKHDIALVMGSGWVSACDAFGTPKHEFDTHELTGFFPPTVAGHSAKIRSYQMQGTKGPIHALVFLGRHHLYEGKGIEPVVHAVRTAVKSGCKIVILTNASGAINPTFQVGQPVLLRDHISLTATSPLIGADFVDLSDVYSQRIREIVKEEAPWIEEGVYVHFRGPSYETPAEIKMARILGGDLVGMSTVPEAIAAHALGAEILGISLVTNAAAGVTTEKINHKEVLETGKAAAVRMGTLLNSVIPKLL